MAYTSQTFSALEQPSLAKWNVLNDNDAFFNSQIGSLFGSGTTSKVWWEEIGRTTLSGAADTITVSSLPARKYLQILWSLAATGGTINSRFAFNSDSGANYAWQQSSSFAASTASNAQTIGSVSAAANAATKYGQLEIFNSSSLRKLWRGFEFDDNAASAAASNCNVVEAFGKWDNTSAQISRFDLTNVGTGDFAIGSSVIVLGHD